MKHLLLKYADQAFWKIVNRRRPFDIERIAYLNAAYESALFVEREMPMAPNFKTRKNLLMQAIAEVSIHGLWMEFGVHRGESIKLIAQNTRETIHGFDSFEGLPEDWTGFQKKGRFSLGGEFPKDMPENVRFVKGWFNESLPKFLEAEEHAKPVAFLHVDSDLYSSAKTVLDLLKDQIVPGTIILFDELLNYPGWKNGEVKAFKEFIDETGHKFQYLGYASTAHSAGIQITN